MFDILYTTRELVSLYDQGALDRPTAFIRDAFFPNRHESETEEVVFDKFGHSRKIAPLVSSDQPGKLRAHRGTASNSFIPPYVKPKHAIRPADSLKRRPGERLPRDMDQATRRELLIRDRLEDQDWEITRREELMAAKVIQTGKVEFLANENHPDVSIDYGRAVGHTVALTSTARWGESGVSPWDSITTWANTVSANKGGVVSDVIMHPLAADLLLKDTEFRDLFDNRRQMNGEVQLAGFQGEAPGYHGVFLGSVGQYRFWQYQQTFEDESGNDLDVWPEYGVGLVAGQWHSGWMAYGAIQDEEALGAGSRFPKMWREDDPSGTFVMTQAAPLPVAEEPNATFFATVR